MSCSLCLADGWEQGQNQMLTSSPLLQNQISVVAALFSLTCLTNYSVLYRSVPHTSRTVPVFLVYIDVEDIGTDILLLSRSWGLEPQLLPWKCAGVVFIQ